MAYSAPSSRSTSDLITAVIWNADVVANPIAIYAGAMSVTSQAVGDILYASSTTQFARVAAVATGQVLASAGTGTVPAYSATPALTSVDMGGTTVYGSRAITVDTGGVLNVVLASSAGDDFTVDTDKLVVSGDSGAVGIGTATPEHLLHIADVGANSFKTKAVFDLEGTRRGGYTQATLELAPASSGDAFRTRAIAAELISDQSASDMVWYSESTEQMRLNSSGTLITQGGAIFNEGSADVDFRVESDGNANMLFVDGGANKVYLGHNASVGSGVALQIPSTSGAGASLCVSRWSNDAGCGNLLMMKSRAATVGGSAVIVADDDPLGAIQWQADDGTDQSTSAASISVEIDGTPGANDMPARMAFATCADGAASPTRRMMLDAAGRVVVYGTDGTTEKIIMQANGSLLLPAGTNMGIGTAGPAVLMHAYMNDTSVLGSLMLEQDGTGDASTRYVLSDLISWSTGIDNSDYDSFKISQSSNLNDSNRLRINTSGEINIPGTLGVDGSITKGSGSFKIAHPLPALNATHRLVHSFIEGPKADLIYRGTVTLVDGTATVDLDEAAGMTTGTWILLCRDEQCFTTNESAWAAVRGSVTGSTLTIDCEESDCTDTVSWMVVACRKDQHIFNTTWTDADGYPIVEPENDHRGTSSSPSPSASASPSPSASASPSE